MVIIPAIEIPTIYQLARSQFLNDAMLSSERRSFLSVASGPEGSTSRHFWKTSQYLEEKLYDNLILGLLQGIQAELTHYSHCMVSLVWQTYPEHHTEDHSIQMNFCMGFLRPAVYSTVHMILFSDHSAREDIDMILAHMLNISSRYTLPYNTQTPYCILSCSAYSLMVDIVACDHRRSLDHGIRCHRDTYYQT